ncbi:MAG: hypothetical protein ACRDK3_12935 [Actinomycetota bacterium]
MVSRGARVLACTLAAAVAVSIVPASAATNAGRARTAAGYIARQQRDNGSIVAFSAYGSTADAIVALVAARRGEKQIKRAFGFLSRKVRNGKVFKDPDVGVLGKIVLALEGAGKEARTFGGKNLVKRIAKLERPSGRLGRGTEVYSHALLILALAAADRKVSTNAIEWLKDAQCGDGGWAFDDPPGPNDDEHCEDTTDPDDFVTSDSNTTSNAIMALAAVGAAADDDPFPYLETLRDSQDGGWGYTEAFSATDANSTSLVIQAHLAAGRQLPAGAMAALKGLQVSLCGRKGGAFRFLYGDSNPPDLGATIAATPALMKKPLPLEPFKVTKRVPAKKPCN